MRLRGTPALPPLFGDASEPLLPEEVCAARAGVECCLGVRCSAIDVSSLARRRRAAPDCAARARNCNIPGACASACARSNESARHHCRAPPCAAIEPRRRRWVHARRHPCRVRLSWPVCRLYGNLVCRQRTLQSRVSQCTLYAATCMWPARTTGHVAPSSCARALCMIQGTLAVVAHTTRSTGGWTEGLKFHL